MKWYNVVRSENGAKATVFGTSTRALAETVRMHHQDKADKAGQDVTYRIVEVANAPVHKNDKRKK